MCGARSQGGVRKRACRFDGPTSRYLGTWSGGRQPTAVDFSVVHALQLSAPLADVHPGKLAKATERRKTQENRALCRRRGLDCCSFVVELLGAWGGKTRYLTQQIIRLWAAKKGCTPLSAAHASQRPLSAARPGSWNGRSHRTFEPVGWTCCRSSECPRGGLPWGRKNWGKL